MSLKYTKVENGWIVGTNQQDVSPNAIGADFAGVLTIPYAQQGFPIVEIGCNAFSTCASITEVVIAARITKINNNAFCQCSSLERINIPSTVQFIGQSAFNLFKSFDTSKGRLTVFFEPNSELKEMMHAAFAHKTEFVVYYCGTKNFTTQEEQWIVSGIKKVTVYSPKTIMFAGIVSTPCDMYCPSHSSCRTFKRNNNCTSYLSICYSLFLMIC